MILQIKADEPELVPVKKHDTDAGWDLKSAKEHTIYPNYEATITTGIKVAIPEGHFGMIVPRSGKGADEGLVLRNTVGIIDADYRGPIICKIRNANVGKVLHIGKYERFAQLIIIPCPQINTMVVEELDDTERGDSGFGASGKI